jgi:hypothetical protein
MDIKRERIIEARAFFRKCLTAARHRIRHPQNNISLEIYLDSGKEIAYLHIVQELGKLLEGS